MLSEHADSFSGNDVNTVGEQAVGNGRPGGDNAQTNGNVSGDRIFDTFNFKGGERVEEDGGDAVLLGLVGNGK